jgi:hypothetical protein
MIRFPHLAATLISLGCMPHAMAAQYMAVPATPQAAMVSPQAAAAIASHIARQIQPCANRQIKPGPGAERIRVVVHVRLNRDGSLIGDPEVAGYDGVDDSNRGYLDRVKNNAVATFRDCTPIRGLPQEYYDVPHGWSDLKMRYKLPG